jgi:hypothetical protein
LPCWKKIHLTQKIIDVACVVLASLFFVFYEFRE